MATLPRLTINDTSIRPDRQQCSLRASRAAVQFSRGHAQTSLNIALCSETSAIEEAKRITKENLGVPNPTEKEYLGQLILNFGKYSNCTFKWMLENDVGYVK